MPGPKATLKKATAWHRNEARMCRGGRWMQSWRSLVPDLYLEDFANSWCYPSSHGSGRWANTNTSVLINLGWFSTIFHDYGRKGVQILQFKIWYTSTSPSKEGTALEIHFWCCTLTLITKLKLVQVIECRKQFAGEITLDQLTHNFHFEDRWHLAARTSLEKNIEQHAVQNLVTCVFKRGRRKGIESSISCLILMFYLPLSTLFARLPNQINNVSCGENHVKSPQHCPFVMSFRGYKQHQPPGKKGFEEYNIAADRGQGLENLCRTARHFFKTSSKQNIYVFKCWKPFQTPPTLVFDLATSDQCVCFCVFNAFIYCKSQYVSCWNCPARNQLLAHTEQQESLRPTNELGQACLCLQVGWDSQEGFSKRKWSVEVAPYSNHLISPMFF